MRRLLLALMFTVTSVSVLHAQSPTAIDGIAMVQTMSADPITLTMALKYDAYVLFRGGVSLRGIPAGAPSTWDADALARTAPQLAGRWSEEGGALRIAPARGVEKSFKDWFRMTPGQSDERLEGVWMRAGVVTQNVGGRASTASAVRELALHADGTFDGASAGGASTGGVVTATKRATAGRYRIDGYEIEFRYDDGSIVRELFCASSSEHQTLLIAGARLIKRR